MLLNDIYDRLNPRPRTRAYQVVSTHGVAPLIDLMIAHHEAAHCAFNYLKGPRVHDVTVAHGEGRGQFRSAPDATMLAPLDTPEGGTEMIGMMVAACDAKTCRQWLHHLVSYAVGKAAQRKFGAKHEYYDSFCWQDYQIINAFSTRSPATPSARPNTCVKSRMMLKCLSAGTGVPSADWPSKFSSAVRSTSGRSRLCSHRRSYSTRPPLKRHTTS